MANLQNKAQGLITQIFAVCGWSCATEELLLIDSYAKHISGNKGPHFKALCPVPQGRRCLTDETLRMNNHVVLKWTQHPFAILMGLIFTQKLNFFAVKVSDNFYIFIVSPEKRKLLVLMLGLIRTTQTNKYYSQ